MQTLHPQTARSRPRAGGAARSRPRPAQRVCAQAVARAGGVEPERALRSVCPDSARPAAAPRAGHGGGRRLGGRGRRGRLEPLQENLSPPPHPSLLLPLPMSLLYTPCSASPRGLNSAADRANRAADRANRAADRANSAADRANSAADRANRAADRANSAADRASSAADRCLAPLAQTGRAAPQTAVCLLHREQTENSAADRAHSATHRARGGADRRPS